MPQKYVYPDGYCDNEALVALAPIQVGDLTEYKKAHLQFEQVRTGVRTPPGGDTGLVTFSNFSPQAVSDFMQKNPDMKFIRIFNGVRENGSHFMFMVAVGGDEMVLDTVVVENCCQCPPRCWPPQGGF